MLVIDGVRIRVELLPVCHRRIEVRWCTLPTSQVVKGGLVWSHDAHFGAELNGHIADGHPLFHAESVDDGSCELDHMTQTTIYAVAGNQSQDKVLGIDTSLRLTDKLY